MTARANILCIALSSFMLCCVVCQDNVPLGDYYVRVSMLVAASKYNARLLQPLSAIGTDYDFRYRHYRRYQLVLRISRNVWPYYYICDATAKWDQNYLQEVNVYWSCRT